MEHTFRVDMVALPWLSPLVLLLVVIGPALAPGPVVAVLSVVVSLGLAFGAVPWHDWHRQQRSDRHDAAGSR